MKTIKAHCMVILATILIAGSFLASNNLTGTVNPISLTLLRFVIATLCLAPVVLFTPRFRKQIMRVLPRCMVISFFYSGYFICLFEALKTTTVLNTGTLYTLTPFITAVLCIFLFKMKVGLVQFFAYVLGAIGTLWVVFNGSLNSLLSLSLTQGDLIFMLGVCSMCGYTIVMKLLYRKDNVIVLTFCTLLGGTLWMTIATVAMGIPLQWDLLQGNALLSMVYLAIGATLLTSYLYQKASIALNPSSVTAYIYMSPACVALLTFLIHGESISTVILFGIGLSAIATLFLQIMNVRNSHKSAH